jgi:hypothetical protein
MRTHPYRPDQLQALDDVQLLRLARDSASRGDAAVETAKRCVAMVLVRHRGAVRASLAAGSPREVVDDLESQVHLRFVARVYSGSEIVHPVGLLMRIAQRVRADYFARRPGAPAELDDWDAGMDDPGLEEVGCAEVAE